LPVNYREYN